MDLYKYSLILTNKNIWHSASKYISKVGVKAKIYTNVLFFYKNI